MKQFIKDLTKREIAFIFIVVLLMATAGIFAWRIGNRNQKMQSISNFDECAAAGNPIMESFPEQCAANGQTFVNSKQQFDPNTPGGDMTSWTSYTSAIGTYTVRIPDGWDMITVNDYEALYGGRSEEGLVYKQGTNAKVEVTDGGWDGASPFSLYVAGVNHEQIVKKGVKQGEISTESGLTAEKYYLDDATNEEGYSAGSKVYEYYFGADGKYIQIEHMVRPGETDQHELVEKMLYTLKVN